MIEDDIELLLRNAEQDRQKIGLDPAVRNLELTPVRYLLARQYGWSLSRILAAELGFLAFLQAIRNSPDTPLTPTSEVDEYWHQAILLTPFYVDLCQQLFGKYLHHWQFDPPGTPFNGGALEK